MRRLLAAGLVAIASTSFVEQAATSQTPSAQARLDTVVEQMISRGARGADAAAPGAAVLLADLRAIDAAGRMIRKTFARASEDSRQGRLMSFCQNALSAPFPKLGEIDADLLIELQESGAAENFEIRAAGS